MSVYEDIIMGLNEAMEAKKRMETFAGLQFCGTVKRDMTDMGGEIFVHAGDQVFGYLNYYGKTPYILGKIEDVCDEYVAPEFWVSVRPETLKIIVNGCSVYVDELLGNTTKE